ncbi:AAA family ATPase [Mycolicibacterium sp. Y3]
MTPNAEPYDGQPDPTPTAGPEPRTPPPWPGAPTGNGQQIPAPPQVPPPYQPQTPWPATPPAQNPGPAVFPPAVEADPRGWDRIEHRPEPDRRPPAPPAPYAGRHAPPPAPAPATGYGPHHASQGRGGSGRSQADISALLAADGRQTEQYRPPAADTGSHGPDESAWSTADAERTGPKQGWRAGMAKVGIKLAKSAREQDYDRDVLRMQRKLAYPQNVLFISLKGGVGKSTSTIALGSTLAHHRDVSDVVAFDSATDGSLRRRMPVEKNRAVTSDARLFLNSLGATHSGVEAHRRSLSGSEVQVQLYSNSFGLQALVAAQHMHDYQLDAEDFQQILGALHNEYMVNLIDMGPDRRVPTFWPAIQSAHAIVLVTTPNSVSIDNVKRFIDLIRDSSYDHLLTRTVLLWNNAAPGREVVINVDATKSVLVRELSPQNDPSTCLVDIPLDPHLAAGGEINLGLLRKETRRKFERAAALLMDKLPDRNADRNAQH